MRRRGWEGGREEGGKDGEKRKGEGGNDEKDNEKIEHMAQYMQSMLTYHCMKAGGTIHSIA